MCAYTDVFIELIDYIQLKTCVTVPACFVLYSSIYIRMKFENFFGGTNLRTFFYPKNNVQITFARAYVFCPQINIENV